MCKLTPNLKHQSTPQSINYSNSTLLEGNIPQNQRKLNTLNDAQQHLQTLNCQKIIHCRLIRLINKSTGLRNEHEILYEKV